MHAIKDVTIIVIKKPKVVGVFNQCIQTNLFKRFLVRRKLFQCFIFSPREEEYYLQILVVKKTTLELLFVTDEVLQNDDFAEEKDKEIINTELQVNIFLDILGFIVIDVLYCSRSYKTLDFLVGFSAKPDLRPDPSRVLTLDLTSGLVRPDVSKKMFLSFCQG